MAKKNFNENAAIRSAIRRVFSRSPIVREVMFKVRREVPRYNKDGSRAKKDAVQYKCNVCDAWTKSTAISVDHIEPVVDVENGFQDWNTFVERLFCKEDNLQVVCDDCHQRKTNEEMLRRSIIRDRDMLSKFDINHPNAKKGLARFTPKRLSNYPDDIKDTVARLKEQLKGTKGKNAIKTPVRR